MEFVKMVHFLIEKSIKVLFKYILMQALSVQCNVIRFGTYNACTTVLYI